MKRIQVIIMALLALINFSCKKEEPVVKLEVAPDALTLKVGEVGIVKAKGGAQELTWSSSNEAVAVVELGIVTAMGIGDAFITAQQGESKAICHVFVTGSDGSSLRLTPGAVEVELTDGTYQFAYGNTYNMPLTWSSSDEEVATVDNNGLVTLHKKGVAFISVTNGGETRQATLAVKRHWGEYKLVWSDEFDGTSLDQNVWIMQKGTGNGGWGNQEKQYYTDRKENIRVEDGSLIIEARKEEYNGAEYTSARIMSQGKKDFTYGKLEARISLPSGGGLWPAFWTLGYGGWPACGEIDIMEYVGNVPNRILGTLHTTRDRDGSHSSRAYRGCETIENNYHVYGIEWTKEESYGRDIIRFYVDDVVYSEQKEEYIDQSEYWPFNKPNYFIINMAVGGTLGGRIDDNIWTEPRLMKVDWVRVYQRDEVE